MEAQISPADVENRRFSAIATSVLMVVFLLLFLFPLFSYQNPPPPPEGILLALSSADGGGVPDETLGSPETESSSEEQPTETETEAEAEEKPAPAEEKPKSDNTPKEVKTDDNSEEIAMKKAEEARQKAAADAKAKADKAKADAEAKRKAAEAKAKAEAEAKAKAEKEARDKFSDFFGGGDDPNKPPGPGNDPNSDNLKDITTGVGSVGDGLVGRTVLSRPSVKDNSQQTGKVAVKVCVNRSGKVTSADYTQKGSTTNDSNLIKLAERKAKEWKFGPGDLDKQCGTITFDFKVR